MEVNHEGSKSPTSAIGLALRCSLNLPGSKKPRLLQKTGNISYILEHGNEKESSDPKYNFNSHVTMEVNHEGSKSPTSAIGLALRCSLNLPGSRLLQKTGNISYILENGNEKESIMNPNTISNAYVTIEVNQEGSELPTPVLGLALQCSLNLPGNKRPRLLQNQLKLPKSTSLLNVSHTHCYFITTIFPAANNGRVPGVI